MRILFPAFLGGMQGVALLILRAVTGLAMMQHGWPKIQHAFNWMPAESGIPSILQALAAFSEFGGGLGLIIGLLTPIAAFGLSCTMFVAAIMVHMASGDPFVSSTGGRSYELAAVYLTISLLVLFVGPGKLSLDYLLFGKKKD
jgi:putative oxidoreductase